MACWCTVHQHALNDGGYGVKVVTPDCESGSASVQFRLATLLVSPVVQLVGHGAVNAVI
jgi:hypothetical protein